MKLSKIILWLKFVTIPSTTFPAKSTYVLNATSQKMSEGLVLEKSLTLMTPSKPTISIIYIIMLKQRLLLDFDFTKHNLQISTIN